MLNVTNQETFTKVFFINKKIGSQMNNN